MRISGAACSFSPAGRASGGIGIARRRRAPRPPARSASAVTRSVMRQRPSGPPARPARSWRARTRCAGVSSSAVAHATEAALISPRAICRARCSAFARRFPRHEHLRALALPGQRHVARRRTPVMRVVEVGVVQGPALPLVDRPGIAVPEPVEFGGRPHDLAAFLSRRGVQSAPGSRRSPRRCR